jgi:hypothetical protein
MPTHPYYEALEKKLFADLAVVRARARVHKMTISTHGKDTQPKRFALKGRGHPSPDFVDLRQCLTRDRTLPWTNSMAASDRWVQFIDRRCRAVVTLHRVDRAYLTSDPRIERVTGPAVKVRPKSAPILGCDHTDVLCDRCGSLLHRRWAERLHDASVLKDARERRAAEAPRKFSHGK